MTGVFYTTFASDVIAKLYLNEDLADVHFMFNASDNDADVQKVPGNKIILAALSPVFHAMFFGSLKEGSVVKITDADAETFKEFLQFFYLGKVTLTMENIETVVRLADKYDVLEAVSACATFLETRLTTENMCWGYQLAINLKNVELIDFCEDKIIESSKDVFATDAFKRCDKSVLKRILNLDLSCEETDTFVACLSWAKIACRRDNMDESQAENLKIQLGDCLSKSTLKKPILIDPNSMYEIRLNLPLFYFLSHNSPLNWSPTIALENGLTIQFHRDPIRAMIPLHLAGFRHWDLIDFN